MLDTVSLVLLADHRCLERWVHVEFFAVFRHDRWIQYNWEDAMECLIIDLNPLADDIDGCRHL